MLSLGRPRHIAIVKPSALGDIVHALPVLSALRHRFPSSRISWIVNRAYEPLLAGHPDLDATIPFDRGAFRHRGKALLYSLQFANRLRRERFDLVIDLQGLLRTGIMSAATGAPIKIGFNEAREGAPRFYTHRVNVPDADRIHAIDRYWRVADYLGAGEGPMRLTVPLAPREVAAAQHDLASLPRPWMAMAVGSRWVTKCWPTGHFARLAQQAQSQYGGSVLFVGTSEDTPASQTVAHALSGPSLDFTGKTSLPRLAALLSQADIMIANDTGPLHLAAALGRPCVAPYTCTQVRLHGPYGSPGGVESTVACAGSYLKKCPHGMICMDDLTPDRLWIPLEQVLSAWSRRCRSA